MSTAELRKFGLSVGVAFAIFGGISWWRGHDLAPRILWGVAVALMVPGIVLPAALRPVQRAWMAMAHVLGQVNTRVILSVLFYLVITPIGFLLRLFRGDPLDRSLRGSASAWIKRERQAVDPARYERQF